MPANNHHIYDADAFEENTASFAKQFHTELSAFMNQCGAYIYDIEQNTKMPDYTCRKCRRKTKRMRESLKATLISMQGDLEREEAALNEACNKAREADEADEERLNQHDYY